VSSSFLLEKMNRHRINLDVGTYEHTGRPPGQETFLAALEQNLGGILKRQKPGPKGRRPS